MLTRNGFHAMLLVGKGQTLVEFGKIQTLDKRFFSSACGGIGVFPHASEATFWQDLADQ